MSRDSANTVRNLIPSAEQAEIMDVLSSAVRADPPIHYYMEQLSSPREQQYAFEYYQNDI